MQVDSLATTKEAIASLSERVAIEDVSLNGIYRFDNGIRMLHLWDFLKPPSIFIFIFF